MILSSIGLNKFNNVGFKRNHKHNSKKWQEKYNSKFVMQDYDRFENSNKIESKPKNIGKAMFYKQTNTDFDLYCAKKVLEHDIEGAPLHISLGLFDTLNYLNSKISQTEFEERITDSARRLGTYYIDNFNQDEFNENSRTLKLIFGLYSMCKDLKQQFGEFDSTSCKYFAKVFNEEFENYLTVYSKIPVKN